MGELEVPLFLVHVGAESAGEGLRIAIVLGGDLIEDGVRRSPGRGHRPVSPLQHKNLNLLGGYSFTASTPAAGSLRPLRDPEAPELDGDEDGSAPG